MMNILDNFRSYLNQNRSVFRAGWLRYIPFAELVPSDEHRFWVVFSVCKDQIPFLEFHRRRQNSGFVNEGLVSKHSLATCRFVNVVITPQQNEHYEFIIGLASQNIRLAADTNEVMIDWVHVLKNKLTEMNIFEASDDRYIKTPELPSRNVPPAEQSPFYEPIFDSNANDEEAPPPYEATGSTGVTSNEQISFRESQVVNLKKEIADLDGLKVKVRRKDLLRSVAWVNIIHHGIFIVGWRQKQCPHLHSIFHIGDQILAFDGEAFTSPEDARAYLKNSCSHNIKLHLRRLPFGKVFCFKRQYDGQDLGIVREKGTAEIKHVKSNSIAAHGGLTSKCLTFYDEEYHENSCNWQLTEINNRSLNLFFKNDEIEFRLNAIGKEISILVQPVAFIQKLQTQLKVNVKNYKEFLVQ